MKKHYRLLLCSATGMVLVAALWALLSESRSSQPVDSAAIIEEAPVVDQRMSACIGDSD
jgi:hypothetical protein